MLKVGDRFYPSSSNLEWVVEKIAETDYICSAYNNPLTPWSIKFTNLNISNGSIKFLPAYNFDDKGNFIQ